MTERLRRLGRVTPLPLLLLLVLGAALLLPAVDGLRGSTDDGAPAERLASTLDVLPDEPLVLIGFDPDIGTFAEVRPTVRALLVDLLLRGSRLGFVSLTSEGRALASAEMARLAREGADRRQLLDLGFVAGAEAGLVELTRGLDAVDGGTAATFARQVEAEGVAAFDAVIVVGGNDIGPRSWLEQVRPRIGDVPIMAVTPTVLLPELQPYLAGNQLAAAIGTPRDGAAYRDGLDTGTLGRLAEPEPRSLPLLVGMLIAVVVLGHALGAGMLGVLRSSGTRDSA